VCRALKVLCVAPDAASLDALKRATVSASWELCPGATDLRAALDQIDVELPQYLVVFGPFEDLVALVTDRFPGMRVLSDRDLPGVETVGSIDRVRDLLERRPRPGGPVT
jgi:hypothetical protein